MDRGVQAIVETVEQAVGRDALIQILEAGMIAYTAKVQDFNAELEAHLGDLADELRGVAEQADPGADLTFEADGARVQATFRGDLGPEFEATLAGELERIATSRQDLRKLIGATTHVVDRGEWVEVPGGKVDG